MARPGHPRIDPGAFWRILLMLALPLTCAEQENRLEHPPETVPCIGDSCCIGSTCMNLPGMGCKASRGRTQCVGSSAFAMKEGVCQCLRGPCNEEGICVSTLPPKQQKDFLSPAPSAQTHVIDHMEAAPNKSAPTDGALVGNFSNESVASPHLVHLALTASSRSDLLVRLDDAEEVSNGTSSPISQPKPHAARVASLPSGSTLSGGFDYHKEPFPLDWRHDGLTILLASLGLVVAASGGIGGGGILVPLFMLALEFKPKHAIALSNFTILGGAIANTLANIRRKHPHREGPIIDWDLILAMEPLTIFGAVFGSLLSKILPNFVLTTMLVIILAMIGQRTLTKGWSMFREESRTLHRAGMELEMSPRATLAEPEDIQDYMAFQSDSESAGAGPAGRGRSTGSPGSSRLCCKIGALTLCFVGTCALTLLKGGGRMASPFGFECGSLGFWLLYFGAVPWVLAFAFGFRQLLVSEFEQKVQQGYSFTAGEVRWDSRNTVLYPLLCAIAGLLAGLFGVGGGIVKGPLMLEMGITPSVASASAAAMILYTSAAASTSFLVFGLLHPYYGAIFFLLGVVCTALGQYVVGRWVHKQNRQSPIVLSIGTVILLSSVFVLINTVVLSEGKSHAELFAFHGVCDTAA